jgi:hypothetical protein
MDRDAHLLGARLIQVVAPSRRLGDESKRWNRKQGFQRQAQFQPYKRRAGKGLCSKAETRLRWLSASVSIQLLWFGEDARVTVYARQLKLHLAAWSQAPPPCTISSVAHWRFMHPL